MAEKICMLSSKGGCGKTTTSLIFSKILAACDKKVLLIDCDPATHGASCFLCDHVKNITDKENVCFINDIIQNSSVDDNAYRYIGRNADDVSKIMQISDVYFIPCDICEIIDAPIAVYTGLIKHLVNKYLDSKFDYIIFDCQAGYNHLSNELSEISDVLLFAAEDDTISKTATDLIKGRLGNSIIKKKNYQFINKCVYKDNDSQSNSDKDSKIFHNLSPIYHNDDIRNYFNEDAFVKLAIKDGYYLFKDFIEVAKQCIASSKDDIEALQIDIERDIEEIQRAQKEEKNNKIQRLLFLGFFAILLLILMFIGIFVPPSDAETIALLT